MHISDELACSAESILYFRCIPLSDLPDLSSREAYDFTADLRPLLCTRGYSRARNKWGAISFEGGAGDFSICATQIFKNREIWGIDSFYSSRETNPKHEGQDSKRIIPTGAVQREYPTSINSIRKVANTLGYGDKYTIEMGLSGAEDAHLAIDSRYYESLPGPFYDKEVFFRKTISHGYPTMKIMNDFWEKLFSEVGRRVPEDLVWRAETT